jgi:hypothetical protein
MFPFCATQMEAVEVSIFDFYSLHLSGSKIYTIFLTSRTLNLEYILYFPRNLGSAR